ATRSTRYAASNSSTDLTTTAPAPGSRWRPETQIAGVEFGAMFVLLAALFVIPIAEIAVIVKVAEWIGTGQMIALSLSVSVVGLWIVKRQGTGALRRIRAELAAGRVPGSHL